MNKIYAIFRRHPRKMLILGMLISAAMLGSGVIRLVSYSLPMHRKQFSIAAQSNVHEWQRHVEEESANNPIFHQLNEALYPSAPPFVSPHTAPSIGVNSQARFSPPARL